MELEFDFIPTKRFSGSSMTEKSISDIEMERIGKICRKYGVSFFMNTFAARRRTNSNTGWMRIMFFAEEENYYTEDGSRDYSNDFSTDNYDRLMDCIHELDCRTCLWFSTMANSNTYSEAAKFSYEDIINAMHKPVLAKEFNCDFDEDHEYYAVNCRYVKLNEFGEDMNTNLLDNISGIYRKCLNRIIGSNWDTGCRIGKASARQLGRYMPLEGLVTCCKLNFKCGKNPEARDFCIYLLQYSNGSIYYLLVDSDGNSHRESHSDNLDMPSLMLFMYLSGALDMNAPGHHYDN